MSKDPIEAQHKFREKESLAFPLLSDQDGDVCERYGVWKERIERTTFVIDGDGRIARIFPRVKVEGHAEEVLEAVRAS